MCKIEKRITQICKSSWARRGGWADRPTTTRAPFIQISSLSLLWLPLELNHVVACPPPASPPTLYAAATSPRSAELRRAPPFLRCSVSFSSSSHSSSRASLKVERPAKLADRLRLGSLTEDGLSYKERFVVWCYEVVVNKTATVATIANLLQEDGGNHAQGVGFFTNGLSATPIMRKFGTYGSH